MAYGRVGRPVRAFRFGAMPPREGEAEAREQQRWRCRYWNMLVELEQERRRRVDAILDAATSGVAEEERRVARKRAAADPAVAAQLAAVEAWFREERKRRRAEMVAQGLYWTTYMDVDVKFNVARRAGELRFHHVTAREGRYAFPFTHGDLTVEELIAGTDTRAKLEVIPPWSERANADKHYRRVRLLRLRVGMRDREPVWLALPVFFHRWPPLDGKIREIAVHWWVVGTRTRWSVSIVVEHPSYAEERLADGPAVAVDLCWRKSEDGVRVAYWLGEDGRRGELVLPASWLAAMERVQKLRSLRDQHRNALQSALIAWIDGAPGIPAWLREERSSMALWRSPRRWMRLWRQWRENRFDGDEAGFALLDEWRKRDVHLAEWEGNLREKLLGEREHRYRNLAAELSRSYGRVVVEQFDLRQVAAEPGADELPDRARWQRFVTAPSELRAALKNAFERDHGKAGYIAVPAHGTTRLCANCETELQGDAGEQLELFCPRCGVWVDQDENACRNLLRRALVPTGDAV